MNPPEILKLAVRLLGLVFLYHGLQALPPAVVQLCLAVPVMNIGHMFPVLIMTAWPLLVAFWLLRGAPLILRIAYPNAT